MDITAVKEQVIEMLSENGANIEWPDEDNGGTIFDDSFELYNTTRKWSLFFKVASFSTFVISALFDFCKHNKIGLKYSRIFCWISILLLFIAILIPGLPNYLAATHIEEITPYCAPEV